jgi:hypothetical protein
MTRKQRNTLLKRIGALVLIFFFVFASLLTQTAQNSNIPPTPTINLTPASVVFPPVPEGGTSVVADYSYFHSSGLMSLPHLVGWDPAAGGPDQSSEQRIEPAPGAATEGASQLTLVGVTFISSSTLSVVHAFSERDPGRKAQNLQALDAYYDKTNLDQAWSNFTGGWKELNRGINGDLFVINFELYLSGSTYLGRQITTFENDWMMVLRLVAPNNNPRLLDQLQTAVFPKYHLWVQGLIAPISWAAVTDNVLGYMIRYPPDWRLTDGSATRPYTVTGTLGSDNITLVTRVEPNKAVNSEDDVRAWLKANFPNSTPQTIKAESHTGAQGFAVSYVVPDPDGNQQSAVATLLNGANGSLYTANLHSSARGKNFLDDTSAPPDITRIRGSFIVVPITELVPTLVPTITPTAIGVPLSPPPSTEAATAGPATQAATAVATTLPPATSAPTTVAPATSAAPVDTTPTANVF